MGWGPGGDNERLAQELLDQNAAIIFKLSGKQTKAAHLYRCRPGCPHSPQLVILARGPALVLVFWLLGPSAHDHKSCDCGIMRAGLAQLRRRSGANLPPSAEEEALLAEAQHCLQSVALLLPPKVGGTALWRCQQSMATEAPGRSCLFVLPSVTAAQACPPAQFSSTPPTLQALLRPTAAKRLRQHLLEPPEPEAATAPAAAEEGGGGKRQQLEAPPMQPEQQQQQIEQAQQLHRQQQLQQLQQHHPGLAAQLQRTHSFGGAPTYSGGSVGARPMAATGSLQPPSSSLLGGLQPAPSASQGSLLGLALGSGRLPASDVAAAVAASPATAGPARSTSSGVQLGLSLGGQQQQQGADALRQQPSMPLAAALQEPTAKEDLWLLSQAYGSMTAEQKEKLAAQPPEVGPALKHLCSTAARPPLGSARRAGLVWPSMGLNAGQGLLRGAQLLRLCRGRGVGTGSGSCLQAPSPSALPSRPHIPLSTLKPCLRRCPPCCTSAAGAAVCDPGAHAQDAGAVGAAAAPARGSAGSRAGLPDGAGARPGA